MHSLGFPVWPAEMDLIFLPRLNEVMLTVQHSLIYMVIYDAIKRTCVTIMFTNAFLNVFDAFEFIKDAFIMVAELKENIKDVHNHLLKDYKYCTLLIQYKSPCKYLVFYYKNC